jgi:hypothetical protein
MNTVNTSDENEHEHEHPYNGVDHKKIENRGTRLIFPSIAELSVQSVERSTICETLLSTSKPEPTALILRKKPCNPRNKGSVSWGDGP